mmetsp:Transcript_2071/g.4623  ORF Transcript_2071/g.4623 Transcript_2071/m.4623 type:complete len:379 (-) Transcript_2071:67-1203(-)
MSVLPSTCLGWNVAGALLYAWSSWVRLPETLLVMPPVSDAGGMLKYCESVKSSGFKHNVGWQMAMVEANVHKYIIQGMREHPDDLLLQTLCSNALCAVAIFNAKTSAAIGKPGVLALLSAGLGQWYNPDTTAVVTGALGCVADEWQPNRNSIAQLGGIQYGLDSWQRHPDHPGALFGVCAMFAGVSYDTIANKNKIIDGDWVKPAIEVMKRFPNSTDRVREEVMQAFNGLSGRPCVAEIHEKMFADGALEAVLMVLRENFDDMTTLTNVNRVVMNFGRVPASRDKFLEADVIPLLLRQLGVFTGPGWAAYVDVDGSAAEALVALLQEPAKSVWRLAQQPDAAAKIEKAMAAKPLNQVLQGNGKHMLSLLRSHGQQQQG